MKNIKLLNVDDSAFMRKLLKDTFSQDPDFSLIDQAANGKQALEMLKKEIYNVVTLDIEMPIMDGIETLKEIMKTSPLPVVMISSAGSKYTNITFDALELGAVDFIAKPSNIFTIENDELEQIRNTVKSAAMSNRRIIVTKAKQKKEEGKLSAPEPAEYKKLRIRFGYENASKQANKQPIPRQYTEDIDNLIVIGTSTGGPRALQEVLPNISPDINAPVLIVQHMPKGFTKSLADRLDNISQIRVMEAEDGQYIKNGCAYIAPGGFHLRIRENVGRKFKIELDGNKNVSGHRPSVDALFESVSNCKVKKVIAVIMTGMGSDGSKGLADIKSNLNSVTIAEDESTCVVYGMPKSAVMTGKVDKIIPLVGISHEINRLMGV